jgi:hypothetical protein
MRPEARLTDEEELYGEVKPDVRALAESLFELSEKALRERGSFLPHAAALTEGKVRLVGAMCNTAHGVANSTHIMPLLRQGLKSMAHERPVTAIGVAETVMVSPDGQAPSQAIKVLLEHHRGLTMAFYLPYVQDTAGDIQFGSPTSMFVPPEINVWDAD